MNKKFMVSFMVLCLVLIMAACGGSSSTGGTSDEGDKKSAEDSDKKKIVLKLASHEAPEAFFSETVTMPFMERVEELTEGQVEFEFYPSQQLGNVSDYLDLTSQGVTDIAFFIPSYTSDRMPYSSSVAGFPGLFSSSNQGTKAFHELIQQGTVLETDYLKNGVRPLIGYVTNPYDLFSTKKLASSPDDLKGQQIRSSGAFMSGLIEKFGGTPVTIATPELYEGLEKGIVDQVGQYSTTLESFGLGELIKYGTQGVSFGAGSCGLIINENVWQSLPKNVQKAFQQAATEVADSGSKADDDQNKKIIEEWSKTMEIKTLSDAEKKEWTKIYEEFNEEWVAEQEKSGSKLGDVLEQFKELLAKSK
jgi:TRAP-type C4-dicarboxylate transport system substrate-binding protein